MLDRVRLHSPNRFCRGIVMRLTAILGVAAMALAPPAPAKMTDSQVRQRIIQQSIDSYPGNCPCPYNSDRTGRSCGGRSAYSRAGGYAPKCYAADVSAAEVRAYRARH